MLRYMFFYWFTCEHTGYAVWKRPINTYKRMIHTRPKSLFIPPFAAYAFDNRPINRSAPTAESRSCLLIGIIRASDVRDCLVIEIVSTIDFGDCQLIGFVRTLVFGDSIIWNCLNNWCLELSNIRTVWSNDSGVSLLIGIVLTIGFRDCPLIGIDWTIDVWCFQLVGIVQTNDLGDRLLIGIVLKIVFTGCPYWSCLNNWCLVLPINWNCPDKWSRRLLIGIVLKFVFTGCLFRSNCLKNWFRVMYMDWNCWDNCALGHNCFGRPSINWNYPDNRDLEDCCLKTGSYYSVEYNQLIWSVHYNMTLSLHLLTGWGSSLVPGTTYVPVIVQYITKSLLLLSTWYNVS